MNRRLFLRRLGIGAAGLAVAPALAMVPESRPSYQEFDLTAGATVYGCALIGPDTGNLLAVRTFASPKTLYSGDTLELSYGVG